MKLACGYTLAAIETLVRLMRHSSNALLRGIAAQALLNSCRGKPKVEVMADGTGSYIEALRLINEQIATNQSSI